MKRLPAALVAAGLLSGLSLSAVQATASDASLEEQREAFRAVWPAAELGEWSPVAEQEAVLRDYVLWPDLRAAWLRAQLATRKRNHVYAETRDFLERHSTLKPARELRYRLALTLAADERHAEYLELYNRHYRHLGVARLDCMAVQAEIATGNADAAVDSAVALWLVARSQADECDSVFDYLRGAGLLDEQLYRQRYDLAISAREFSLARYLARSIDSSALDNANRWMRARDQAEAFLDDAEAAEDSERYRQQLLYALERLTYSDADLAAGYWENVRGDFAFRADDVAHIARHIALWTARQHRPGAVERLRALPEEARDREVRRWLARAALAREDWTGVIDAIERMPPDERQSPQWRYWLAVGQQETGETVQAAPLLAALAEERGYYGFLAADELGSDYPWLHDAMQADEEAIRNLGRDPSLVRARELYHVGQASRGRSEWNAAVEKLDREAQTQALLLAHRWNWHSRAIAMAGALDLHDDLAIRYPLAYREQFETHSAAAGIPGSWAYGIARSESLFMADVRSGAGAIGVMQLMPSTGRRTAAELQHPYSGLNTLTDPHSNIRLGTHYLGKMLQRFGDRAAATAAYNAGPHRVEEWLPEGKPLDARIWIENIPYNETRRFVRRVLVSDTIFHWRMTGRTQRLSAALTAIDSTGRPRQVADVEELAAGCPPGGACGERVN